MNKSDNPGNLFVCPGTAGPALAAPAAPAFSSALSTFSSVLSWWEATGSPLVCTDNVPTLSLPPSIYTLWLQIPAGDHSEVPISPDYTVNLVQSTAIVSSPTNTSPSQMPVSSPVTGTTSPENQSSTQTPAPSQSSSPSLLTTAITSFSSPNPIETPASSSEISSATSSTTAGATDSISQAPSDSVSQPAVSPPALAGAASHNDKTARIVAGVLVPLVVIALGITAFIIYKRRRRVHDRREWERTHEEIADAVRQVGAATPAAVLATGPPAWGDVKPVPDGDSKAPLMDSSGGTPPGSLGHPNDSDHALLSHSRESSA